MTEETPKESIKDRLARIQAAAQRRKSEQDAEKLEEARKLREAADKLMTERAVEAGLDPATVAMMQRLRTDRTGPSPETLIPPDGWFMREQEETILPAFEPKVIEDFVTRMNDLARCPFADIDNATARVHQLFAEQPPLTTLINTKIMHTIIARAQEIRRKSFSNAVVRAGNKATAAKAAEGLSDLMNMNFGD